MKPTARWHRSTLPNGMTVLYRQDKAMPLAHASLLMRAGTFQESPSQADLASLTLDLMMEGTPTRSARQIADAMETIGGSLGAQAHEDFTDFGFVVPAQHLPRALDVLSDILQNPSFREKDIRKEKTEVLADLASRSDAIFNVAHDALMPRLFPDHAYGRPVEGIAQTVKNFKRADFKTWHAQSLQPGRMILSLMGPWGFDQTLKTIRRAFVNGQGRGGARGRPGVSFVIPVHDHVLDHDLHFRVPSRFKQAYLMKGYRAPCYGEPLYLPLKILNIVVGGGMSSRLFWELREKRGLAYEVSSYYSSRTYGGAWVFYMGLPVEKRPEAVRELNRILQQIMDRGISLQELRQAKQMMRGGYLMENQPRRRQSWYAAWWMLQGKEPDYGLQFLQALDRVTLADVKTVAQTVLSGPSVMVEVVPQ